MRHWIAQGLLGMAKTDLVLAQIGACLDGVELDAHSLSMHHICIATNRRRASFLPALPGVQISRPTEKGEP